MRQGITVFLDVPLDALARRIAAVGTDSRPLLHFESGDAYTKVAINSTNSNTLSLDSDFIVDLEKNWICDTLDFPAGFCGTVYSNEKAIWGICQCWCYGFPSTYAFYYPQHV